MCENRSERQRIYAGIFRGKRPAMGPNSARRPRHHRRGREKAEHWGGVGDENCAPRYSTNCLKLKKNEIFVKLTSALHVESEERSRQEELEKIYYTDQTPRCPSIVLVQHRKVREVEMKNLHKRKFIKNYKKKWWNLTGLAGIAKNPTPGTFSTIFLVPN